MAQIRAQLWQMTLDIHPATVPLEKCLDGQPVAQPMQARSMRITWSAQANLVREFDECPSQHVIRHASSTVGEKEPGTVGAAMEAAINRVPAVAVSVAYRGKDFDFAPAAQFTRSLVPILVLEGLPPGVLLNVNVPQPWNGTVRFTRQSSKITRNLLQPGADPRGRRYFWLHEQQLTEGIETDTDHAAIRDGAVSITPLVLDHTHSASLNHLSHWGKLLEKSFRR